MTPTHELLETIVQAMNVTVTIDSIVTTGTSHQLNCSNTLWLGGYSVGKTVTIDGVDYEITAIVPNSYVTVTHATDTPTAASFDIDLPEYRHGTPLATLTEINNDARNAFEKYPMIWLREVGKIRTRPNQEDIVDTVRPCNIHFLVEANFSDWTVSQHEVNAVRPAWNMHDAFIDALKAAANIQDYHLWNDYESSGHVNWGVYQDSKGQVRQLINDHVSGVISDIDIPFLKDLDTCN